MSFQSHLLELIIWGRNQGRVLQSHHNHHSLSSLRHLTTQRRPLLTWLAHLTRPVVLTLTLIKWKPMPSLLNSRRWVFSTCIVSTCSVLNALCTQCTLYSMHSAPNAHNMQILHHFIYVSANTWIQYMGWSYRQHLPSTVTVQQTGLR